MKIEYLVICGIFMFFILLFIVFIVISRKKVARQEEKIVLALNSVEERLADKEKIIVKTKDLAKDGKYLKNFQDEDFERNDIHELYELLDDFLNKFEALLIDNEDLANDSKISKVHDLIIDNEIQLKGAANYYNDMVNNYLELKNTFPISIVKIFSDFNKYKKIDIKKD